MALDKLLKEKKSEILGLWRDRIFESYHPDARKFLQGERDRFNNPVGSSIKRETEAIYDGLLEKKEDSYFVQPMDNFIRIRSVQDFCPSEAVDFMYILKVSIREKCAGELNNAEDADEWLEFEKQIDKLTFMAFDLYMNCREHINRIRVDEIKKRSAMLFEKAQRKPDKDAKKNNNPNDSGVG